MKSFLLSIKFLPVLLLALYGVNSVESRDVNTSRPVNPPASVAPCVKEDPVYSTKVLPMLDNTPGCYKMQMSVYVTHANGQVFLTHSAIIQSGAECDGNGKILNNERFSAKSGREYIIKDDLLNGPIEVFLARNNDVYQKLVAQKEVIMGIR